MFSDIIEYSERGLIILSPAGKRPKRRVIYVNGYGGRSVWLQIKRREVPSHHLWGCIELVRMGYEVALAEPIGWFNFRKPFPHDLSFLPVMRNWLGKDGLVYCGQNTLFWTPFLRSCGIFHGRVVSMLYAREPLHFERGHTGILALTPAAAEQAQQLAPKAKVAHISWGVDLDFVTPLPYKPAWLLSCGITHRDLATLSKAAESFAYPLRMVVPGIPSALQWPSNVTMVDGGPGWNCSPTKKLSISDLISQYYSQSAATLIIIKKDAAKRTACGFTNLLEAMALANPVVVTRTGALADEIDVEKVGCGLHVEPSDPAGITLAVNMINSGRAAAEAMGKAGRRLCEEHYNIKRYSTQLDQFFDSL